MKPQFGVVYQNYPRLEKHETLFTEMGWADLNNNNAFKDTCAIRMSYALRLSSVPFNSGTMKAKAGKVEGKIIEIRHADLSRALENLWGTPEIYKGERAARDGIGSRTGVVSLFRIEGGSGGHIDLIGPGPNGFLRCARSCHFSAVTIWFWELP